MELYLTTEYQVSLGTECYVPEKHRQPKDTTQALGDKGAGWGGVVGCIAKQGLPGASLRQSLALLCGHRGSALNLPGSR